MSKELRKRNELIYAQKHRDGKTYKELANEFEITETRIRQILEQERRKRHRLVYVVTNKTIKEIEYICNELNVSKTTKGRIYNALAEAGLLLDKKWMRVSRANLLKIPNLGKYSVEIILKAAKLNLKS